MKCMSTAVLKEAQIDFVSPLNIVSTHSKVLDLDLNTMKKDDVNFSNAYELRMIRSDRINGLVSWFDCIFEDPKKPEQRVVLSTAPGKHGTHWKQTTFYINLGDKPCLLVKKDDVLHGSLACTQSRQNFRELNVKISYHLKRGNDEVFTSKAELYKVR
jgi:type I protein arginine methyltransferase